jgi:predicted nucleic acid-binding protein
MATTAGSAVFVDTNILVYANFPQAHFHELAFSRITGLDASGASLWTSRQVLREFLATATRPGVIDPPPTAEMLSVVATMKRHGIQKLLTHNVEDFVRFVPEITLMPLVEGPNVSA